MPMRWATGGRDARTRGDALPHPACGPSTRTGPPARQLTRSAAGESHAAFLSGGDLLFTSARPDPDAEEPPTDPPAALWRLPAPAGSRAAPGTVRGRDAGSGRADACEVVVVALDLHRDATTLEEDAERSQARATRGHGAAVRARRVPGAVLGPVAGPPRAVPVGPGPHRCDDRVDAGRPRLLAGEPPCATPRWRSTPTAPRW
jgi:hypothetical protein